MTYFFNRRRRRHRSRLSNRRRHSRRRHYNRRRRHYNRRRGGRRRRHYNRGASMSAGGGLSISRPFQAVKAGFKPSLLIKAGVFGAGMLGNAWLSGFAGGFLPSMVTRIPFSNYLIGIATAGIGGALTALVSKKSAPLVFFGGLAQVGLDITRKYILPLLPKIPGLSGLADYLTRENAAMARPLGFYGDYLTRENAAMARPLGGMSDFSDAYVTEELAGL